MLKIMEHTRLTTARIKKNTGDLAHSIGHATRTYRDIIALLRYIVGHGRWQKCRIRYEACLIEVAPNVNEKVWKTANALGFGRYFVQKKGGFVTDDHTFINKYAKIPTIDIVPYYPEGDFFEHWHTVKDDMDAIDKATLQAVGQTVMQVIYSEK